MAFKNPTAKILSVLRHRDISILPEQGLPVGIVLRESHRNAVVPQNLANEILPRVTEAFRDRPKILHLEWKKNIRNLRDLKAYMCSGDDAAGAKLVRRNVTYLKGAWRKAIKVAREQNFEISLYDKDCISFRSFEKKRRQEIAFRLENSAGSVICNPLELASKDRVRLGNPVMAENIRDATPLNAVAIVVTGDAHARGAKGLPKLLNYPSIKMF